MYNAGDFNLTETVHIPVNTFDSNDPTASCTVTDLAAGDIEIHKDGSATQRSSDNGVTVDINFDSVIGNHMIHIDLSDDTDAGFYANGSRYLVRVEGITVDAGTLNAWVGGFSIGCTLRPTTAGRTLDIQTTGEVDANLTMIGGVAQSATDLKDFADAGYNPADHKIQGVVLTDTCTTNTDMVSEPPTAAENRTEMDSNSTQLTAIKAVADWLDAKKPSKNYLTATNNADGDIEADEMTGDIAITLDEDVIEDIADQIDSATFQADMEDLLLTYLPVFSGD